MLLEPALRFAEARAEPRYLDPEPPGVVHFPEVCEFMQDEVIADQDGGLHQSPVEGDGAAP